MTALTLKIQFHRTALRETQAWFLAGDCTTTWLREICEWDVQQDGIILRAVPRSMTDRSIIGVVITVGGQQPTRVSPRLQPYGMIAGRLILPVNARLEPAAEDDELNTMLDSQTEYVWHPVSGLVSFKTDERLTIADLIKPPPVTDADWAYADPGVAFAARLVSVAAVQLPSIEDILESGRDDIGTATDDLKKLPRSPDESSPGLIGKAAMLPLWAAARATKWLAGKAPGGAEKDTWVDRLHDWAARLLSPDWQSARQRELDRLMNLLADDPDQGLKYALPMGGEASRGVAPPSSRLAARDVDFRLGSGSGPADYWGIPPATWLKLTAQYRELAEREIRLGRHRRAAYIYAELLNDLPSAASALQTGGYFREAAVLFKERLNQPHEAAKCLERGGHWNDAIALYEELDEHESAGRIYRKLEQHEQADTSYRRAVEQYQAGGQFLRAADLLESELHAPEEAIQVLRVGWPDHADAAACLQREFRLFGQIGRHNDASRRIAELREQKLLPDRTLRLAEVLSSSAAEYPDTTVCDAAADATRIIVSRRLLESQQSETTPSRPLLATVEKLAPDDRLLRRDCHRYQRTAKIAPKQRISSRAAKELELVQQTRLQFGVVWVCGAASRRYFFTAGVYRKKLLVTRREWSAIDHAGVTVQWDVPTATEQPILLAPSPVDKGDLWVHLVDRSPLPPRQFPSDHTSTTARTPPWSDGAYALTQTANGVSWMVAHDGVTVVKAFSENSLPILSQQINRDPTSFPVPFHARTEGAFVGLADQLVFVDGRNKQQRTQLPDEIIALSGSNPQSRVRVAASFPQGAAVVWKDATPIRRFADDLTRPMTTFTVSGHLVAVDADRIEVYRSERQELSYQYGRESPGEALAVLPVRRNEFAVLDRFGGLTVYRIPTC